jgi:death-on-curing protein
MKFLSKEEVKQIHDLLIVEFGGSKGLRDENLLDSAISRMNSTFDGKDLYETIFDKTAALFDSLCKNHPFIDGNKRTAITCAATFLDVNGYKTNFDPIKTEEFVLKVATSKVRFNELVRFFKNCVNR